MLVGAKVAEAGSYAWLAFLLAAVATINDVLIQMIMAARVLYGMVDRGQRPRVRPSLGADTDASIRHGLCGTLHFVAKFVLSHRTSCP